MPRIIFLNRYFYPDHSATSQILSDLALHLAAGGRDVHVVTSRQRYDDAKSPLPAREKAGGVDIHRVSSTRFGRSSLPGRGLDYLSFYAGAWTAALALTRPGDILVAKTDPPLLSILAAKVARRCGAQFITWLQDLYPEVASQLGVPLTGGLFGALLSHRRDRSLSCAANNVVLGTRMAARLAARGIAPERISVIANWVDDEQIVPVPRNDNPLRTQWGLQDKFVVGYSGNLGRAHEFATVLGAAERLRGNVNIAFLLVGGGKQFEELAAAAAARGLQHAFHFVPYQDRAALKYSLSVPDVHWISLRPELEGLLFPSKFYGALAAGRPVIAITAANGEIAELVRRQNCGAAVAPGEDDTLAAVLTELSQDEARRDEMGRRARELLEAKFARRHALARWEDVLNRVSAASARP